MLKSLCIPISLAVALVISAPGRAEDSKADASKSGPDPVHLSGTGDRATRSFELAEGLTVWNVRHVGPSNFKVHLMDDQGVEADLWVNQIGNYEGKHAGHVRKAGRYRLQVDAIGEWSVAVDQPRPVAAPESPRTFSGKGADVSTFFTLRAGAHVFEASHKGKGVFRAQLLDSQGKLVDQVAGVIGGYDGSKVVKIDETGIYLMRVVADGNWSVSTE